jgi:outer membrane protein assembly factor BamB
VWNQFHADSAGTGAVYAATKPADGSGVIKEQLSATSVASPVVAPDGRAYVSMFIPGSTPYGRSELLRLSTAGSVAVEHRFFLEGQATTPAVDDDGNVYVTHFMTYELGSALRSFDSLFERWTYRIVPGRSLTPPRIVRLGGRTLILVSYVGGVPFGGHVLITDQGGVKVLDVVTCLRLEGPELPGFRFRIEGIDLGYPYPEEAAVAIRTIDTERGPQNYLVVATDRCGVSFSRLDLGTSPPLTPIGVADSDAFFAAPLITPDGTAVVVSSDQRVSGYDVTTGKEKWHYDTSAVVWAAPTMFPLGLNIGFIATNDRLIKLDLTTGTVMRQVALGGTAEAAPAAAGNFVFVSTSTGLHTFDLDLMQHIVTPLPGGQSSPAIGRGGEVHVLSTDRWYHVFPAK